MIDSIKLNKSKKLNTQNLKDTYTFLFYELFDIFFSLFALLLFSPLFLIIAIAIKIKSPNGSIFFKQERLGLDGKEFEVYKFRTMILNAEKKLEELLKNNPEIKEEYFKYRKLKYDPRIIPSIGIFLRKSSLDELPQFFNVLKGDMSIVGPRPYIKNEFVTPLQKSKLPIVLSVKPGITGYWQTIPHRHDSSFDFRVEKDIEYIQKKNFRLDLKIIFNTIGTMVLKKGM